MPVSDIRIAAVTRAVVQPARNLVHVVNQRADAVVRSVQDAARGTGPASPPPPPAQEG